MQSRLHSLAEILFSTLLGYVVAVGLQIAVFPLFGIRVTFAEQNQIGLIFTVVSLVRGYLVRRFFNWLKVRHQMPIRKV